MTNKSDVSRLSQHKLYTLDGVCAVHTHQKRGQLCGPKYVQKTPKVLFPEDVVRMS